MTIVQPSGDRLSGSLVGLSVYDPSSGRDQTIATIKNCVGRIVGESQVVYPDAFDGIAADVRITYAAGYLETDVILWEAPAIPTGFSPETCVLRLITDFAEAKPPRVVRGEPGVWDRPKDGREAPQNTLFDFGDMQMVAGWAFDGRYERFTAPPEERIAVTKEWMVLDDRQRLVESISIRDALPWIQRLPLKAGRRSDPSVTRETEVSADGAMNSMPYKINAPCLVLDYVLVVGQSTWTFAAGTTYLVNSSVTINGSSVFNGGAIIKYARNATLTCSGSVLFNSSATNRVIFTAKDDDTVGEKIADGLLSGYYAATALNLYYANSGAIIKGASFRHATAGVTDYSPYVSHHFQDCDTVKCLRGFAGYYTTLYLSNVVACDTVYVTYNHGSAYFYQTAVTSVTAVSDSDLDGLSALDELTRSSANPLNAYSKSSSIKDGRYAKLAEQNGATKARLTGIAFVAQDIRLTLESGEVDLPYDIYWTPVLGQPWRLLYTGKADNAATGPTRYYTVPNPNTSSAFFTAGDASDTELDGLPDGYEILIAKTVVGAADSASELVPGRANNGIADGDEDLDGDGLPNQAERRLRTNPIVADNPLNLGNLAAGSSVSGQRFLSVAIPSYAERLPITMWVDGFESPDAYLDKDANGNWGIFWETRHQPNGTRGVRLGFNFKDQPTAPNQARYVLGAQKSVQYNNVAAFPRDTAIAGSQVFIEAYLQNLTSANYQISLANDAGQTFATISGQTADGVVTAAYDLNQPGATTGNVRASIILIPPDGLPINVAPKWFLRERAINDGRMIIAWAWDTGGNASHANRKSNMILDGWVSPVGNPALDDEYLLSPSANVPFGGTFRLQTPADLSVLEGEFRSSANANFLYFGHGDDIQISPFPGAKGNVNILADDIERWLGNKAHRANGKEHLSAIYQNKHPYRLAILHSCSTYSKGFSEAFGVDFEESSVQVYEILGREPRAFVGWTSDTTVPGQFWGIDLNSHLFYTEVLATFSAYWMAGATLDTSLAQMADKYQQKGFGESAWDYAIAGCADLTRLP